MQCCGFLRYGSTLPGEKRFIFPEKTNSKAAPFSQLRSPNPTATAIWRYRQTDHTLRSKQTLTERDTG